MKVIEDKILIRELEYSDFAAITEIALNTKVKEHLVWNPSSAKDVENDLNEAIKAKSDSPRLRFDFTIIEKVSNNIIGKCGIVVEEPVHKEAWIVYYSSPSAWNKGYANIILQFLTEFGFKELRLHRITAFCDIQNRAAQAVLSKFGFTNEGMLREHKLTSHGWRSSYLYSLLENEFDTM